VDLVVVNKADGELEKVAKRAAGEYSTALRFLRPKSDLWTPRVKTCSSLEGSRVDDVWKVMQEYRETLQKESELELRRGDQRKRGMWTLLEEESMRRFSHDPRIKKMLHELEYKVFNGDITPGSAADELMSAFFSGSKSN